MQEIVTKPVAKEETCNCDAIKAELEAVKAELTKATELNAKYEQAYAELVTRYNKLRSMLDNIIEYSLSSK